MREQKLNKSLAILGFILLLILTYFRENLLLEVNALINKDVTNRAYSYWFYTFFKHKTVDSLIVWKWGITLSFSITMASLTIGSLYSWFKNKPFLKLLVIIYLSTFAFIVMLAGLGFIMNQFDSIYPVLRKLLGVIQSPIPFFSLFLLIYWVKNNEGFKINNIQ